MTTAAYDQWVAAGKPYTLCRPAHDLIVTLRTAGYTVYHYPDLAHLTADPPQDHTPYSATGWPVPSARWIGHAIDIMPAAGLMPLPQLAMRIIDAKNDGAPGASPVKYINWTDTAGKCWHYSWQPSFDGAPSTDRGHIHISFRSDMDESDVISRTGWNPLTGGTMTEITPHEVVNAIANGSTDKGFATGNDPYAWAATFNLRGLHGQAEGIREDLAVLSAKVNALPLTGAAFAGALIAALTEHPEVVDALATAVASRVGMIPTAQEIARAVGELAWHGQAGA